MDPEIYKNLLFIKVFWWFLPTIADSFPKHYEGNLDDMSLTFSVSEDNGYVVIVVWVT